MGALALVRQRPAPLAHGRSGRAPHHRHAIKVRVLRGWIYCGGAGGLPSSMKKPRSGMST